MGFTAEQRWSEQRDRLLAELGDAKDVRVEIPGWEPVDLQQGLGWLQATYYEAFRVEHEVLWLGNNAIIHFRVCEN